MLSPLVMSGYATFTNGITLFTLEDIVQYTEANELYLEMSLWIFKVEQDVVAKIYFGLDQIELALL